MEEPTFARKPEIVVGLVAPVGVDLDSLKRLLKEQLSEVGYEFEELRLSELLAEIFGRPVSGKEDHAQRIQRLMDQGDALRECTSHPDAAALLAMAGIRRIREKRNRRRRSCGNGSATESPAPASDTANVPLQGHAFILHSLKTPAEVELLRNVYGLNFLLIAGYSRRQTRVDNLIRKIAKSCRTTAMHGFRDKAEYLMQRDEHDKNNKEYGQNVQDTFPKADFFVDVDSFDVLQNQVQRIVRAFFGFQFHTPSKDEYGMFHAVAAARRSADLSRQVGAAIASAEGDIVAVGCNEVPKAGGGMYWEGDDPDTRDFRRGCDSSHKTKQQIVDEIYGTLTPSNRQSDKGARKLSNRLRGTLIMDLLEFGRIVHAEMAALIDAARRGVSIRGGTMYVTTFPCHMCARHMIAAGIDRVVYIEPYPKSRILDQYRESILMDGSDPIPSACPGRCQCQKNSSVVTLEPFVGVAPRQYMWMFAIPDVPRRKDEHGDVIKWDPTRATPRFREFVASYIFVELRAEQYLARLLSERNARIKETSDDPARNWIPKGDEGIGEWLARRMELVDDQLAKLFPKWVERVALPHKPAAASKRSRAIRELDAESVEKVRTEGMSAGKL
jgi:deoxycytidylate deaminase